MGCKVHYLNSAGIMSREIPGVEGLAKAFPSNWLLYVSLNCFPKNQDPVEIDAFVVMDDRILVLELKDWNGELTSQGDRWFIGGQNRGRSAVIQVGEKAKKLKTVLSSEIAFLRSVWIDYRVVLTASATRADLPGHEKPFVWTLQEASSIALPQRKLELLEKKQSGPVPVFTFEKEISRVVGNTRIFRPLEADFSGYRVVEQDTFVHPRKVWREHRGEKRSDPRFKALIRSWSFNLLPASLNSAARRRLIADRETRALGLLSALGSDLIERSGILRELGDPSPEILTNHFEVRELLAGWTTLDRYLERRSEDLERADRLAISQAVLSLVAELHVRGIAHRDLAMKCLWIGGPTKVAVSGLMCCQLPDEESVVDWLSTLQGYAPPIPEDRVGGTLGSAMERDVYLIALILVRVLGGSASGSSPQLPEHFAAFGDLLGKSLRTAPSERFNNAGAMASEFAIAVERIDGPSLDQSLLDRYETSEIPYLRYPNARTMLTSGERSVYLSITPEGQARTVKIWNGLLRGVTAATDLALLRLLDSVSRVMAAPVPGLPTFLEAGLSPIGPYVVYVHRAGNTLDSIPPVAPEKLIRLCQKLLSAVRALHDLGCEHGDISLGNAVYENETEEFCLLDPFDISFVGRVRTPAFCPENWERLTPQAVDRFGAVKLIERLLLPTQDPVLKDVLITVRSELERESIETLDVVFSALHEASREIQKPAIPEFTLRALGLAPGVLRSDGGAYFATRKVGRAQDQILQLVGTNGRLELVERNGELVTWSISPTGFPELAHASRSGERVEAIIRTLKGEEDGFLPLFNHIRERVGKEPAEGEAVGTPTREGIDVERLWRRLIDLESSARTRIEIEEELASREDIKVFRYSSLGSPFDFDPDEPIDVYTHDDRRIGEIDKSLTDSINVIGIRGAERRLSPGDVVSLVERRGQVSINRRARAVDRILARQSAIPNLIEYFKSDSDQPAISYDALAESGDLADYKLNTGQTAAFVGLLAQGPLGLLQGPPGTGKTHFIASFVHWLVTKGGARRVLLTSQSHEAVNNAIEALVQLFKSRSQKPSLLRIGSRGIPEKVRPFHTVEIRERYRSRFEAAIRYRYLQLTSARGISRAFAAAVFDCDASVGMLARRCNLLGSISEGGLPAIERERDLSRLERARHAFQKAASKYSKEAVSPSPLEAFEEILKGLRSDFPETAPADLVSARAILGLARDWLAALGSRERNFDEFLAKTRSIVTATCVGVGQTKIRMDAATFDWVIVDEAARCTPSELAVPVQLGRRLILVGDHLQLRPMVARELVEQLREEYPGRTEDDLSRSDFERAKGSPYGQKTSFALLRQYRMENSICELVSTCFYKANAIELETAPDRVPPFVVNAEAPKWLRTPLTWLDTSTEVDAKESQVAGTTTFHNLAEVRAVMKLLDNLARQSDLLRQLATLDEEFPIGVICMYSGQRKRLEMLCARQAWDPSFKKLLKVDTVDAYQGKQNAVVIISLVRSNPEGDMGHVGIANRCNVALSRAKERLFIVGAVSMWSAVREGAPMRRALQFVRRSQHGQVIQQGELE